MRKLLIVLAALSLLSTPAMALTTNQRESIAANCSGIKAIISQVRRADTVARIKRGRSYEQTSRLLDSMNAHLGYNGISQPLLTDMTSEFKQAFSAYQGAFREYERVMEEAEKTNCMSETDTFYARLLQGRAHRRNMASAVTKAESALKIYREGIDDLRKRLEFRE